MRTDYSIETGNPERTEIALLLATTPIRMLTGFDNRFIGLVECTVTHLPVPFGTLENLLVTMPSDKSPFDAHKN